MGFNSGFKGLIQLAPLTLVCQF